MVWQTAARKERAPFVWEASASFSILSHTLLPWLTYSSLSRETMWESPVTSNEGQTVLSSPPQSIFKAKFPNVRRQHLFHVLERSLN